MSKTSQNNPQLNNNVMVGKVNNHQRLKLLVITLVALAVVGAIIWLVFLRAGKANYQYTYTSSTSLQAHKVSSSGGKGVTIDSPSQFKTVPKLPYGDTFANFSTLDLAQYSADTPIASLSMGSSNSTVPDPSNVALSLAQADSDKAYQSAISQLTAFINTGSTARFKLSLGHAQPFVNSHIKTNAWQFDITYTDSKISNTTDPSKIAVWKGKAIYAIGQNAYYYVDFGTASYNWTDNLSVWQQVQNSLQIDQ